jgi:serine/threonine-protein kinase
MMPGASSDDERELVRELQLLERLAEVHGHAGLHAPGPPVRENSTAARAPLSSGAVWGPLRIVERLGSGTFGDVYRAFDTRLEREVALKLLRPLSTLHSSIETLPESAVVEEGRLMARVRHPGVVTVHGAERVNGQVGVWMELVDGRTLGQEVAERGPLPPHEIQQVGVDLADALAAVHRAGVLHRDVKAQNVMRDTAGRTVLMDFGTGVDFAEHAGALAGTPLYLAPEVITGGHATRRSDIYSLGVLLFHLATGTFPVRGGTIASVRRAHAQGELQPLRQAGPGVPRPLAAAIQRAIALDPSQRYPTAEAMADALRSAVRGVRRRRMLMALAVAIAAIGAALPFLPLRLLQRGGSGAADPPAWIVEQQIDPDLQRRVAIRGPAIGNRWIPCHPRGTRGVAVCDLSNGSVRPLRMPSSRAEFSPAQRAVLSPDAAWIAYQWIEEAGSTRSVSVNLISTDGSRRRELYRTSKGLDIQKWTTDGGAVLVRESMGQPDQRALWLPAAGGEAREVMRLGAAVTSADLSADGHRMLVTRLAGEQHDFSALDVATGAELWKMAEPTDDFAALWTPDGRGLAFVSDRTGCESIAFLQVQDDRPVGAPVLVKDMGRSRAIPQGFSPDGAYLVTVSHAWRTAFRTRLDLTQRTAEGPRPLPIGCKDDSIGADWDPTGERIAFLSGGVSSQAPARIIIQSRLGHIEREVAAPGRFAMFGRVRWSPDGATLAVRSTGPEGADILTLVDLVTGEQREIASGSTWAREDGKIREIRWAGGGGVLYFQRDNRIHAYDLRSSTERVIYGSVPAAPGDFGGFDVRRADGALLGLVTVDDGAGCIVRLVTTAGVAVDRQRLPGACFGAAWSHDGTRILAATLDREHQLWLLEHEGGAPARLPISSDVFWDLSVSPNGRELLFSAGNPRPTAVILRGLSQQR